MASAVNQSGPCANAVFLEHYLDCLESLPEDVQKNVSQLRELDLLYRAKLEQIDHLIKLYLSEKDNVLKSNYLVKIQRCLVRSQEYGDEKLQLISQIVEVAENKNHQIGNDAENVDMVSRGGDDISSTRTESPVPRQEEPRNHEKLKRPRRQKQTTEREEKEKENNKEKEVAKEKKSKRTETEKSEKSDSSSGVTATPTTSNETTKRPLKKKAKTTKKKKKETVRDIIDPNEPTYCLCQQVSYGEMIGCDNEECPIEWFHFSCVSLTVKPKGKWYCPACLSERKEKAKK